MALDLSMKQKEDYTREFMQRLKMTTPPVAIALRKEKPEVLERMRRFTFCQVVREARMRGKAVYVTGEDLKDEYPLVWLGFDYHALDEFRKAKVLGPHTDKLMDEMHRLKEGEYPYIGVAPLHMMPGSVDLVNFVGDMYQMMRLVNAYVFQTGEKLCPSIYALSAMCSETVAATYNTGKPQFIIPCPGCKQFGKVADSEAVFTSPPEYFDDLIEGLKLIDDPYWDVSMARDNFQEGAEELWAGMAGDFTERRGMHVKKQ